MKFFAFFINNRKFTWIMVLFTLVYGIVGMLTIASEEYPTVNLGIVKVTTYYKGAPANEIETKITKPIEDEIRTVTGLKKVMSTSQPGISGILVMVDIDKYNADEVITDVERAIDRATGLPKDLDNPPSIAEVKSEEFPIIEIAVTATDIRQRSRAAESLKEKLEELDGISSIRLDAITEREFLISLDSKKLNQYQIDINMVIGAISARNRSIPGGFIENNQSQILIRMDSKVQDVESLGDTVIRSNFSGKTILLSDVANIEDTETLPNLMTSHNGRPAALVIINKKGGYDLVALAEEVKKELAEFQKKTGEGVQFSIYNNVGIRVSNKLSVLRSNGVFGLLLVIIFLIIFLPGRAGLMTSLSLPLSVLATLGYMHFNNMTLNTVTILALIIALGMLVDNSVVIAENFNRLKNKGLTARQAMLVSLGKLWLPISVTAFTTIAAFLPMLVTTGIMGQFIRYIPLVVTAALLICLIECFIFLPARLVPSAESVPDTESQEEELHRLLNRADLDSETTDLLKGKSKDDWFTKWIQPKFESLLKVLIHFRYLSSLGFMGLIIGSLFVLVECNRFDLFPSDQVEIYIGRVTAAKGSVIEKTDTHLQEIASRLYDKEKDNIAHVVTRAGLSAVTPDDPKEKQGESVGIIFIFLDQEKIEVRGTQAYVDVFQEIGNRYATRHPGLHISFEPMRNGPPVGADVTGVFRSNNPEQLEQLVERVYADLAKLVGLNDLEVNDVFGEQEVEIQIDFEKASRLGVDPTNLQNTVRAAFAGFPAASINLNDKEIDLLVQLQKQDRDEVAEIDQILVSNNRGRLIPLPNLVSITEKPPSRFKKRYDYKGSKTLTAAVNPVKTTVPIANQALEESFNTHQPSFPEVSLTLGGAGENTKESMESLSVAMAISIIGIFALLVFLFKSFIRPVIILTTVPLGIVGVSAAFYVQQLTVSFMALIGVVGLGGIIVNSGIVLISFIEDMRKNDSLTLNEVLIKSSALRLRAVIVTALTTVSGLMPTAYGIGGSDAFIVPMAMSLAWGLVSGTTLALLWVPCAYAITEDFINYFSKKKKHSS